MANVEEKLESGATLQITTAPMDDCDALIAALARCLKGVPLNMDIFKQDATALKDIFAEALASSEVKAALWKCAQRSTYNGDKVTKQLFDDPKKGDDARRDYFLIMMHIIKVNCGPFFEPIFSRLKARMGSADVSQKPA